MDLKSGLVSATLCAATAYILFQIATSSAFAATVLIALALAIAVAWIRNKLEGGSSLKEAPVPGFAMCNGHFEPDANASSPWARFRLEGHNVAEIFVDGGAVEAAGERIDATWNVVDPNVVRTASRGGHHVLMREGPLLLALEGAHGGAAPAPCSVRKGRRYAPEDRKRVAVVSGPVTYPAPWRRVDRSRAAPVRVVAAALGFLGHRRRAGSPGSRPWPACECGRGDGRRATRLG